MSDDAHALHRQIKAAETLRAGLLAVTDDTEAIRDTIEGETSLHETIRAVLLSIEEDQAMVDGLKSRIADLGSRKSRFEDRIEAKRALIEQALAVGEIKSIETDLATVSLRAVPPRPVVTEEHNVPSRFWLAQPPKLDTRELLAALRIGPVPGASLSNGGVSLSIRRA